VDLAAAAECPALSFYLEAGRIEATKNKLTPMLSHRQASSSSS